MINRFINCNFKEVGSFSVKKQYLLRNFLLINISREISMVFSYTVVFGACFILDVDSVLSVMWQYSFWENTNTRSAKISAGVS